MKFYGHYPPKIVGYNLEAFYFLFAYPFKELLFAYLLQSVLGLLCFQSHTGFFLSAF